MLLKHAAQAYLPGAEVNHDHEGGSSRVRSCHCTPVRLTPTITPNVGNSSAQFLLAGTAFALSLQYNKIINSDAHIRTDAVLSFVNLISVMDVK